MDEYLEGVIERELNALGPGSCTSECESVPGESKWTHVKSTPDGMGEIFKCRHCGREVMV